MRKNIDDRFKIEKDGEIFHVQSLVRDDVDADFLLTVHESMRSKCENSKKFLEQIPTKIEHFKQEIKNLEEQRDSLIPKDIASLEKKMDEIWPHIKEIKEEQKRIEKAKLEAEKTPVKEEAAVIPTPIAA